MPETLALIITANLIRRACHALGATLRDIAAGRDLPHR